MTAYREARFADLEHKLIVRVEGLEVGSGEVTFYMGSGHTYRMFHYPDCCENVEIVEIVGDVPTDWLGCYVSRAEESSREATEEEAGESGTWTFYRIDTTKGCFVIRWLGRSNGYYSEVVAFEEVNPR